MKWLALLLLVGACHTHAEVGSRSIPAPAARHAAARTELALPIGASEWSPDGHYVVFRVQPRDYAPWDRADVLLVVDASSHATHELDHVSWYAFAPDHVHFIAIVRDQLVVYDLPTGEIVGEPAPIVYAPRFAPDGRLAWAEAAGEQVRIHLRAIGGTETVLTGLPIANDRREPVQIDFLDDFVVAADDSGLRVWQHAAPIIAIDTAIERDVLVSADGLAYIEVTENGGVLRHIDLAAGERAPAPLPPDRVCGAGAVASYEWISRCGDHRYLVRAPRAYCVWDVARHRVQARIRSDDEEHHCTNDLVWLGNLPPGGPYDYYSALTGRPVRAPEPEPSYLDDEPRPEERPGKPVPEEVAARLGAARSPTLSPAEDLIAGILDDRGTLWTAAGALVWQSPVPSEVGAIALSERELIAVGRAGEVWHVDLATRALRSSRLSDCDMTEGAPIVAMPDGRAAVPCHTRANGRALRIEGSPAPIAEAADYGWYVTASAGCDGAVMGWLTGNGILARTLPAGTTPLAFDPAHYGLAITADGSRFATAEPAPDAARPYLTRFRLVVRDAKNATISTAVLDVEPGELAFSTDGSLLAVAVKARARVLVLDVASAAVVDDFAGDSGAPNGWEGISHVAWSPVAPTRLAYYRKASSRVVIRDVRARRDVATYSFVHPPDGVVRALAWSPDGLRLALLADQHVTLWDRGAAPTTFAFAGHAGTELRADGTVRLLGEPTAASALLLDLAPRPPHRQR